jgi:hypothetical protein
MLDGELQLPPIGHWEIILSNNRLSKILGPGHMLITHKVRVCHEFSLPTAY